MPSKDTLTYDCRMRLITLHLPIPILEFIETMANTGLTASRSEFIRNAIIEKVLSLSNIQIRRNAMYISTKNGLVKKPLSLRPPRRWRGYQKWIKSGLTDLLPR